MLHSDSALVELGDDAFDTVGIAEQLAARLTAMMTKPVNKSDPSFVIALDGPWGSGKTTLLAFMEHHIRKSLLDTDYTVVRFDPWWLADGQDLKRKLIEAIFSASPFQADSPALRLAASLSDKISKVPPGVLSLLLLSEKTKPLGEALKDLGSAAGDASKILSKTASIRETRDKLASNLADANFHALVIIDDIDRLRPADALDTLDAVRTVADLPGVIYILCYDQDNISRLLRREFGENADYLGKIVNVSLRMPELSTYYMRRFLLGKFDVRAAEELGRPEARPQVDAVMRLLDTPRDINKVANAFSFWSESKRNEIYLPDFLLLEAIRNKFPASYVGIIRLADIWFGTTDWSDIGLDREKADDKRRDRVRAELHLTDDPNSRALTDAIVVLFPGSAKYFGQNRGSNSAVKSSSRRVSDRLHFYTYFLHQPIPGMPSRRQLNAVLYPRSINTAAESLTEIAGAPAGDIRPLEAAFTQLEGELREGPYKNYDYSSMLLAFIVAGPSISASLKRHLGTFIDENFHFVQLMYLVTGKLSTADETIKRCAELASEPITLAWITSRACSGTDLFPFKDEHRESPIDVDRNTLLHAISTVKSLFWTAWESGEIFKVSRAPSLYHMVEVWGDRDKMVAKVREALLDRNKTTGLLESYDGFADARQNLARHADMSSAVFEDTVKALFAGQDKGLSALRISD